MTVRETPVLRGDKVRSTSRAEGALWTVTLDAPKGNVLDSAMTGELTELFLAAAEEPRLKGVLLTAEGEHFSFGASVEEHRAAQVRDMLTGFHGLFRAMAAAGVPIVAAVRGCCLGGGLELAAFCHRVVAHPRATFGQPEVKLGVIAPVGSAILAARVGRGAADDLLLSGRTVKASQALAMRLVDDCAEDPEDRAREWVEEHLLPLSASSLRFATRAARLAFMRGFEEDIRALETLYLGPLMATHDANEGIAAFLEKRQPAWRNN